MASRPVNPQFVSMDEYDMNVFPGFLRRTVCCPSVCVGSWSDPRRALDAERER